MRAGVEVEALRRRVCPGAQGCPFLGGAMESPSLLG